MNRRLFLSALVAPLVAGVKANRVPPSDPIVSLLPWQKEILRTCLQDSNKRLWFVFDPRFGKIHFLPHPDLSSRSASSSRRRLLTRT